jgi:tetratricopeptide (TPR) repeat protein
MIDWSFALLDPAERALFAQLGLFAGSFSAEAAAAVGERDVRETLAALAAKSLVTAVPGSDAGRYRLSENQRAYALDRLREGEAGDGSARHFAAHFAAVAKAADARYGRMPNDDFLAMVEPDIDNFRAALEWTLGMGNDVRLGAELAGSMGFIYRQTALFVEGTGWAERALAAVPDAEPPVAARLHMALAFFSFNVGGMGRTLDEAVAAEALYREAGNAAGLAWALGTQAFALYRLERPEDLRAAAEAAVRVAREAGDPLRLGSALTAFALSLTEDRAAERFDALEEALRCCRDAGDSDAIVPTAHLAAAYYEAGDFARALAHISDVAAKARKNRDRTTLASALVNVASYALALDDVAHAEAAAREVLTLVRDLGKTLNAMCGLQLLGSVAGYHGDHVRAVHLAGAADRLYREFDLRREAMEQTIHSRTVHDATAALGPKRVGSLLAEGAALPLERAIEEALAPIP